MDGMLSYIKQALCAQNGFEQNRKDMRSRTLGILLYQYERSLRNYQPVVSSFEPISHDAIRNGTLKPLLSSLWKKHTEKLLLLMKRRPMSIKGYIL
jgi:hypothetical protein